MPLYVTITPTDPTQKRRCMYHQTIYALRENSGSIECQRHANRKMECQVPIDPENAKPPYNVGNKVIELDLCFKHHRAIDYILGSQGFRSKNGKRSHRV